MIALEAIDAMTDEIRATQWLDAQLRFYRTQARWEPWKALAALFGAAAIFAGAVLALSNWISRQPQTINVHLDAPLTISPK
jgi:hypothetical protein